MDIYETYDALVKSIAELGEKWKEAANSDKRLTYAGMQERMKINRLFIDNERNDIRSKLNGMKKVYNPKLIDAKKKQLLDELDETAKILVEGTRSEIKELSRTRKDKIGEMLCTPPSKAHNQLLAVLQMRNSIDAVELNAILPALFGNYQAMRVLQDIGAKNGVQIAFPVQLDPRTLFVAVDEAEQYLYGACEELVKPWNDVNLRYRPFYTPYEKSLSVSHDLYYNDLVSALDTVPQLQSVKARKVQLTPTENARIEYYYGDVSQLDTTDKTNDLKVLKHTKAVMDAHPEIIELLKLSKYAPYVSEVEEAKKAATPQVN